MQLNPMYVNSLIDIIANATDKQEAGHVAMACITQAYASIMETGITQSQARRALREMLDYAIDKSTSAEEIKNADKRIPGIERG